MLDGFRGDSQGGSNSVNFTASIPPGHVWKCSGQVHSQLSAFSSDSLPEYGT